MLADSGLQYQDSLCTDCIRSTRCHESSSLPDTSSRSLQKTVKNPLWCTEKKHISKREKLQETQPICFQLFLLSQETYILYHLAKQNTPVSQKYQPVSKIFTVQPPVQLWKVNPGVLHSVHQDPCTDLVLCTGCHSGLKKRRAVVLFVRCILPTAGVLPHANLWLNKIRTIKSKRKLTHAKVCPQLSQRENYLGDFRYQWLITLQVRSHWTGKKVEEREQ